MIYNCCRADLGSKISLAMRSGVSCNSLTCSKENLEIDNSVSEYVRPLSSTLKKMKNEKVENVNNKIFIFYFLFLFQRHVQVDFLSSLIFYFHGITD